MKTFVTIPFLVLTLSTMSILAQDARVTRPVRPQADARKDSRPNPEETFKRLDVNADGKISKEEASPRLQQNFERFDVTGDGFITLREFRAVQTGAAVAATANYEETFKRLDVNADGKISREEASPRLQQNFDRFDISKDGFITLREFNAASSTARENRVRPGA